MNNKPTSQFNSLQHNYVSKQITQCLNEVRDVDETETQFTSPGCRYVRKVQPAHNAHWPRQTHNRGVKLDPALRREKHALVEAGCDGMK
jgi:hypothetical protein